MIEELVSVTDRMIVAILKQEKIPEALFQELLAIELTMSDHESSIPELLSGLYKGKIFKEYCDYLFFQVFMLRSCFTESVLQERYTTISDETSRKQTISDYLVKFQAVLHLKTVQYALREMGGVCTLKSGVQISREEIVFHPNVVAIITPTDESSHFWEVVRKQEQNRLVFSMSPQVFWAYLGQP